MGGLFYAPDKVQISTVARQISLAGMLVSADVRLGIEYVATAMVSERWNVGGP
jgi:hypothetical protein